MKPKLKFSGIVKNGKYEPDNPVAFVVHVKSMEGKKVNVIMNLWREFKPRSNNENSYFHGVVLPILSELTGYTEDEMKAVVKFKFKIQHTSTLSTAEFEDFMSKIRSWASIELGCYVPEPNESPIDFQNENT